MSERTTEPTVTPPAPTSWRSVYPVHPCADVFPMMSEPELEALAADIKTNGLREPVVIYRAEGDHDGTTTAVLDGRNRLEALARLDVPITTWPVGEVVLPNGRLTRVFRIYRDDPAAFVISANIRRRHLSKEQQAELIVKTIGASTSTDHATVARSVKRDANGRVHGREKDPILTAAVSEAAKHGISKRTVQSARAKVKGKTPAPKKPKHQKLDLGDAKNPIGVSATLRKNEATPLGARTADLDEQIAQDLETIGRAMRQAWARYSPGQARLRLYTGLTGLFENITQREWGFKPGGTILLGGRRKSK